MRIIQGDLDSTEVIALLQEHLDDMRKHSPPGSAHALDLAGLRAVEVTFWAIRDGSALLGCGALKELDKTHGEIKSMRTSKSFLGRGVAKTMLSHIIEVAKSRSYARLSLETGSGPAFEPALVLYEKFGFRYCGPFADYREDPFSRFMTLEL
ncbi:MAG: GNAT family N-acetyltransferase [Gammaproteobacteria bacterium]|nr:GNAT family N-acetyltransferase [Gammaproteobacteria bacterium]MDH4314680.1 GNAT family N-acetyltransferase [Gammaproteobacteria bacterium]MDH5213373.1 GNAT family N-acetyltransferase [Gammaproteobacteria bacterium]MDH5501445.1 GNAT family N-acetyltransferase [Gammaproteobacteria bacterium]